MKKIALIPTYEPDNRLIELVEDLCEQSIIIVVVDDGSGEKYKSFFSKIKEKSYLISYANNKGKGNRYEYEMNVLLNLPREGIKIEEIEIKTIYIDNNSGSYFNTVKDSFRIYKQIIKFSFSSFVGFIIDYISYSILMLLTNNLVLANIMARVVSSTSNYTIM